MSKNDMPEVVTSCIEMFADDAKVFKAMMTEQDRSDLEEDLDNLQIWASTWKMKFNADKCKVLHIGNQNPQYELTECVAHAWKTFEKKRTWAS